MRTTTSPSTSAPTKVDVGPLLVTVVALVSDLMDRSRITAAITDVSFGRDVDSCVDASVVIVDLVRHGDTIAALRTLAPAARIVAFGPHVDVERATQARAAGADAVLPRSRFFRDPAAAIAPD